MDKKEKDKLRKTEIELIKEIRQLEQSHKDENVPSWLALYSSIQKRAKRKRLFYITSSIAAVALLLILIVPKSSVRPSLSKSLLEINTDYNEKEIMLLSENQTVELENKFDLTYNSSGVSNKKIVSGGSVTPSQSKLNKIIVPKGRKMNITFSDGSHMHVNSGSQIVYPSVFDKDKREILVNGEVYITVTKDKSRPFIIQTQDINVKVLGTSFNLSSYGGGAASSVVLLEGCVEMASDKAKPITILPNQKVSLENNTYSVEDVDPYKYISWIDDLLVIDNLLCGDVLKYLSDYYGVEFIPSPGIEHIPVGGKIDLKNEISRVLENFCYTLNLKYKWKDNSTVIISCK